MIPTEHASRLLLRNFRRRCYENISCMKQNSKKKKSLLPVVKWLHFACNLHIFRQINFTMRSYLNSAFNEELLGLCADTWRKQDFMLDTNSLKFLPVPQCCRQSHGNITEQFISNQFWRNIQFLYQMLQNNCFVPFF